MSLLAGVLSVMLNGEGALGLCGPEPLICNGQCEDLFDLMEQFVDISECTRQSLTTVLDVERELEGLLELTVAAGGSHLQNHRELSESRQAHTHKDTKRHKNEKTLNLTIR